MDEHYKSIGIQTGSVNFLLFLGFERVEKLIRQWLENIEMHNNPNHNDLFLIWFNANHKAEYLKDIQRSSQQTFTFLHLS